MQKAKRHIKKMKRQARDFHKHPFIIPVIVILVLSFGTMIASVVLGGRTVGANDTHIVQLSIEDNKQVLPTRATTVGDFLTRAKVTLHEGDVVEPAQDTPIDEDNFRINVYRAKPVTIFDGDKRIQALSAATTPRSIAAQAGVPVYPEDGLTQTITDDVLKDQVIGDKIVIDRATPTNLNLYGTQVVVRTRAKTVGDLLKEKQVTLASGDTVQPSQDTPLTANSQVFVTRSGTQIVTLEEPIAMEKQTVEDPNLSFGSVAVRQKGSPGKKLVTYQLDLKNGREVGRQKIQEVRTLEPVTEITARGKAISIPEDKSAWMAAAGISPSDYPYVNYIISRESGWCPTKLQGHPGACPGFAPSYIPSTGGYGLCQSTPGSKMATAGADWQSNPITQLRWCSAYAQRKGGWQASYEFWLANHWW